MIIKIFNFIGYLNSNIVYLVIMGKTRLKSLKDFSWLEFLLLNHFTN